MLSPRLLAVLVVAVTAAGVGVAVTRPEPLPPTARPSPTAAPAAVATPAPRPRPSASAPVPGAAPRTVRPVVPALGADVSWPNCPLGTPGHLPKRPAKGLPMPGPAAQFLVIGLTNGPGFYPNPCVGLEVQLAKRRHLLTAAYAFATLPNAAQISRYGGKGPFPTGTALGRIRNAAYAEAQVNIGTLRRSGLRTPIVWMDVEPQDYLSPWGSDVTVNRAVLRAMQLAYTRAGLRTGFYSAPYAWKPITGNLRDSSPTWVTSGPRSPAVAAGKCLKASFSGGPVALSQYWVGEMDLDLTCPLVRRDVQRWFATN